MTGRELGLELPADASFIRLARMLVAGFAAECHGLDEARLAGLRLAVSEVCGHMLAGTTEARRMRVDARAEGDQLDVWIRDRHGPVADLAQGAGLAVADALVDELHLESGPDHQVVHLRLAAGAD